MRREHAKQERELRDASGALKRLLKERDRSRISTNWYLHYFERFGDYAVRQIKMWSLIGLGTLASFAVGKEVLVQAKKSAKAKTESRLTIAPPSIEASGDTLVFPKINLPLVEPDFADVDTSAEQIDFVVGSYQPGAENNMFVRPELEAILWCLGLGGTKGDLQKLDARSLRALFDSLGGKLNPSQKQELVGILILGLNGRWQYNTNTWNAMTDEYRNAPAGGRKSFPSELEPAKPFKKPESKIPPVKEGPKKPEVKKEAPKKPMPEKKQPPKKEEPKKEIPPPDAWVGIERPTGMGWERLYKRVEESVTTGKPLSKEENKDLAAWKQYFDKILGTIKKKETEEAMSFHDIEVLTGVSDPVLRKEGFRIIEGTIEGLLKNSNLHANVREGYSNLLKWLKLLR